MVGLSGQMTRDSAGDCTVIVQPQMMQMAWTLSSDTFHHLPLESLKGKLVL